MTYSAMPGTKTTGIALQDFVERMNKMKRLMFGTILVVAAINIFLSGCTADIVGQRIGSQIQSQIASSETPLPVQSEASSFSTEDNPQAGDSALFPIVFPHTHAGDGTILVSVNNAVIVRNLNELPVADGFVVNTSSYGGTEDNPVEYNYPDMFLEDGSMRDEIYMVLLDVTVANPDGATSRFENLDGSQINHYPDPYMFQAQELCELICPELPKDLKIQSNRIGLSYFSEKSNAGRNHDAFLLPPGEEKNFQLGFFVGYKIFIKDDQIKGFHILPEDLSLWALLPGPDLTQATWDLHLQ